MNAYSRRRISCLRDPFVLHQRGGEDVVNGLLEQRQHISVASLGRLPVRRGLDSATKVGVAALFGLSDWTFPAATVWAEFAALK